MNKVLFEDVIEIVDGKSKRKDNIILKDNTVYKNKIPYVNLADAVLAPLMEVKNQGGFRPIGECKNNFDVKYVVLYSNGSNSFWNDKLDLENGTYTYYGDNDKPNNPILNTNLYGNKILKKTFELSKGSKSDKKRIPPFFLFEKNSEEKGVDFIGLLVPGLRTGASDNDLVIEKVSTSEGIVENYKSTFSIIDIEDGIDLRWLADLKNGIGYESQFAPVNWKKWIDNNTESKYEDIYEDVKENIKVLENKFIRTVYEDNKQIVIKDEPLKIRKYEQKDKVSESSRKKPDYVANEAIKVVQGEKNEEAIYRHELEIMMKAEADEQVKKMEGFFKNKNDTEGYDILSFELIDGEYQEKYIEVKSTQSSDEGTPIDITKGEIEFAKKHMENYYIYRIINSNSKNRYVKIIKGIDLFKSFELIPTTYKLYGLGDVQ